MASNANIDSVVKGVSSSAEKAGVLAKNAEKEVSDIFGKARDFLTEKTDEILPTVEIAFSDAKSNVEAAMKDTTATIKKYPMQSLLVGFGIGCVVGFAIRANR